MMNDVRRLSKMIRNCLFIKKARKKSHVSNAIMFIIFIFELSFSISSNVSPFFVRKRFCLFLSSSKCVVLRKTNSLRKQHSCTMHRNKIMCVKWYDLRYNRFHHLPKMATSTIAGMRWVDNSIVVIIISSSVLTIQGSNKYFFFCYIATTK